MGRRSGKRAAEPVGGAGPDLRLALALSLLAGGIAAYPSLSAAAEGRGELIPALTLFLLASLVALIGFGTVALVMASARQRGHGGDRAGAGPSGTTPADGSRAGAGHDEAGDGPVPTLAIEKELGDQSGEIDDALAATDALVHEQPGR